MRKVRQFFMMTMAGLMLMAGVANGQTAPQVTIADLKNLYNLPCSVKLENRLSDLAAGSLPEASRFERADLFPDRPGLSEGDRKLLAGLRSFYGISDEPTNRSDIFSKNVIAMTMPQGALPQPPAVAALRAADDSAEIRVAAQDSLALVDLYNSTGGPTIWTRRNNWLAPGQPVSSWEGVTVQDGRVVGLSLSTNNLVGSLPASFRNLSALASLVLSANGAGLTGVFDISNMPALTEVTAYGNSFDSFVANTSTNYYTRLSLLQISGEQFSGSLNLNGMPALTTVELVSTHFSELITNPTLNYYAGLVTLWPDHSLVSGVLDISGMPALTTLRARSTQLTQFITHTTTANYYRNLSELLLSNSQFAGELNIVNMPALTEVTAYGNSFDSFVANTSTNYYTRLSLLQISGEQFSGSLNLNGMPALTTVELVSTHFSELITNPTLNYYAGLVTLWPDHSLVSGVLDISGMPALTTLRARSTQLTQFITHTTTANYYRNLSELLLSNSQFAGELNIVNMPALTEVTAYGNKFEALITNPTSVYYPKLTNFQVQANRFDFCDLVPAKDAAIEGFLYAPQDTVGTTATLTATTGQPLQICGDICVEPNDVYRWSKNGALIPGASGACYTIAAATPADAGVYTCTITNPLAPALTLYHRAKTVQVAPMSCAMRDSLILTEFYHATNGPGWTNKTNWLVPGQPISNWHGVRVNGNGCVVSLDLYQNNLMGVLPVSFRELDALETLVLADNNVSGTLDISNMMDIGLCQVHGNQLDSLVTNRTPGYYHNLNNFYLSSNPFRGILDISNMPALTVFYADNGTQFDTFITNHSPNYYPNLVIMGIKGNKFTGTLDISNMPSLGLCQAHENQFDTLITNHTPNYYPNLWNFYLSSNQFTGTLDISNMPALSILYVGNNQFNTLITNHAPNYYPDLYQFGLDGNVFSGVLDISNMPGLGLLQASGYMGAPTSTNQFDTFVTNPEPNYYPHLWQLFIAGMRFNGALNISNMPVLQRFIASGNHFSELITNYAPNYYLYLAEYGIDHNEIVGLLNISNMPNLTRLDARHNHFESVVANSNPNFYPNLSELYIHDNRLDFCDIIPVKDLAPNFGYSPQDSVGTTATLTATVGQPLQICPDNCTMGDVFHWSKDGQPLSGTTNGCLVIPNVTIADAGVYTISVTNPLAPALTLYHRAKTVKITDPCQSNQPPVAGNDNATTPAGQAITIFPLANDTDAEHDPLSIAGIGGAACGAVTYTTTTVTFTPAVGAFGPCNFSYIVTDGCHRDTAQVTVTVTPTGCPLVYTHTGDIYTARVTDNDQPIPGTIRNLSNPTGTDTADDSDADIFNHAPQLIVVWTRQESGAARLYRTMSTDNGLTWSAPAPLFPVGDPIHNAQSFNFRFHPDGTKALFITDAGHPGLFKLAVGDLNTLTWQEVDLGPAFVNRHVLSATFVKDNIGNQLIAFRASDDPGYDNVIWIIQLPGGRGCCITPVYPPAPLYSNNGDNPPVGRANLLAGGGSTLAIGRIAEGIVTTSVVFSPTLNVWYAPELNPVCQNTAGSFGQPRFFCDRLFAVNLTAPTRIVSATSCASVGLPDSSSFYGGGILPGLVDLHWFLAASDTVQRTLYTWQQADTLLNVENEGHQTLFNVQLSVSPASSAVQLQTVSIAQLNPGASQQVRVTVNPATLTPGTYYFTITGASGGSSDNVVLRVIVRANCPQPVWTVNPNAYPDWLTIFGRLTDSAGQPLNHNVRIAAYLNDELRGTVEVDHTAGYFTLLVYGRNNERNKPVVFDVYDPTDCPIKHLCDHVLFDPDGMIGSTFNPRPLQMTSGVYQRKVLSAGVNYITFYVDLSAQTLNQALAGLNGEGRHIQNMNNPSQAASFNPSTQQWHGTLQHIECGVPYKLTMSNPLPNPPVLCLSGTMCPTPPINPPVVGWNRVGTMNNEPVAVEAQFADYMSAEFDSTQIKTEKRFTVYYDGQGGFMGSYKIVQPGDAAKLYKPGHGGARATGQSGNSLEVDPTRYEDFMTLIATLTDEDGAVVPAEQGQLIAKVGADLRGVAVSADGLYILGIYGNAGDRQVDLFLRDARTGAETPVNAAIRFAPDAFVGEMFAPYPLVVEGSLGTDNPELDGGREFKLLGNWPNPFNPRTTIAYQLSDRAHVRLSVYDVSGRLIKALVNQPVEAGRHEVEWDGTDTNGQAAGSGVYFYRLEAGRFVDVKRGVMLK